MTQTTMNRPFEKIATSTLMLVVKRDRYQRFSQEFQDAFDYELQVRNLRAS